jgi:tetratricopeptide (TPR) repeat protein
MLELSKWDLDVETNDGEEYTSLVRAVQRTHQRFKLLFVSCSPSQGEKVRCDLMADISMKKYELLDIKESIDNLYEAINNIPNLPELDVLFIRGLEYSIFEYEDQEFGDISKRSQSKVFGGSWAGVPPVLAKLNMQRELFRDRFPHICFVFLLPHFAVDYFIRRAPDFYDWKSGIYRLGTDELDLQEQLSKFNSEKSYENYNQKSTENKQFQVSRIRAYLDEVKDPSQRSKLLFQLSASYKLSGQYSQSLKAFSDFLLVCPNSWKVLSFCREIINDFSSIHIDLNLDEVLLNYAKKLNKLDKDNDTVAIRDSVVKLELESDIAETWYKCGFTLFELDSYDESIANYDRSCDHAVKIESDVARNWYKRGLTLSKLDSYDESIANYDRSYDHAVKIEFDVARNWYKRGLALFRLGRYEESITSYDRAIELKSDVDLTWYKRGLALFRLGRYEESITSYDRAIELKPDVNLTWYNRGLALFELGRYEESISSYDRALKFGHRINILYHSELALKKHKERTQVKIDKERTQVRIDYVLDTISISQDILHGIYL